MRRLMRSWKLVLLAVACAGLVAACGSSATSTTSGAASASSSTSSGSGSTGSTGSTGNTGSSSGSEQQMGFEGVPIEGGSPLAPASTTGTGTVDGISCAPVEQLAYHIHAHLAVFQNGQPRQLPGGIGIPGSQVVQSSEGPVAQGGRCIYWLHTHAPDGVIHIESPTKKTYTLGDFFDEWHQPLSSNQVASLHGTVAAFVNGKPWHKNVRDIPLLSHEDIQLDLGQPVPPITKIDWAQTQL